YPDWLAPGETGYYTYRNQVGQTMNEIGYFAATLSASPVEASSVRLTTSNVSWTNQGGRNVVARGTVRNASTSEAKNVQIGVVFLDPTGYAFGFTYARFDEPLAPGESRPFIATTPSVPPEYEKSIATAKAFAYEQR